ncbi:hypothetical protein ACLKA6_006670 [Drosophila palustris]
MPCSVSNFESGSNRYRSKVRIGNWFEDHCLEEDKMSSFRKMRDRGELLVEKARTLFDNFQKEVQLAAPKHDIMIGAHLSVVINEHAIRSSQTINEDCELTVAPSDHPCVRNSFRIVSGDEQDRDGERLKYGQRFRLECVESHDDPILLYSAPKLSNLSQSISTSFNSQKFGEVNLPLGLVHRSKIMCPDGDIPKAFTNWFCMHVDPNKRFESEGETLPSNSPLVIVHAATNRNLAAENVVIQTLFGPEFLVSVQNYRNVFKREIWKNVWMISNGHHTHAAPQK